MKKLNKEKLIRVKADVPLDDFLKACADTPPLKKKRKTAPKKSK